MSPSACDTEYREPLRSLRALFDAMAACDEDVLHEVLSAVQLELSLGGPIPSFLEEQIAADAAIWACAANSLELLGYARAALAQLSQRPRSQSARIGVAAIVLRSLSDEECRAAFRRSRRNE